MGITSSIQSHPKFSIDGDIIRKKQDGYHSIYTKDAMKSGAYSYLFRIIKSGPYLRIGVDDGETTNNNFSENDRSQNWGYDTNGHLWSRGFCEKIGSKKKYGVKYGDGDIVNMDINISKNILSFTVNNKKQSNVQLKPSRNGYRVAIYLYYKDYSIKIMPSKKEEQKEQNDGDYEKALSLSLKDQLKVYKQEIKEQRMTIQTLQINTRSVKNESLINELREISQQKAEFEKLIFSLQKETETLKVALVEKEHKNVCLMEEQKESLREIEDLKEEIKQLKIMNLDESGYYQWENEQILEWILSLENGRYAKYGNVLRESLKEEGIKGIHFQKVNESDVRGWGVKAFEDKKDLTQSIQRLVQRNSDNQNLQNEGAPTAFI